MLEYHIMHDYTIVKFNNGWSVLHRLYKQQKITEKVTGEPALSWDSMDLEIYDPTGNRMKWQGDGKDAVFEDVCCGEDLAQIYAQVANFKDKDMPTESMVEYLNDFKVDISDGIDKRWLTETVRKHVDELAELE